MNSSGGDNAKLWNSQVLAAAAARMHDVQDLASCPHELLDNPFALNDNYS